METMEVHQHRILWAHLHQQHLCPEHLKRLHSLRGHRLQPQHLLQPHLRHLQILQAIRAEHLVEELLQLKDKK